MTRQRDDHYMTMALALARKGIGRTSPNPAVGAVVVRRGSVVGRGWHAGPGQAHAELIALQRAGRLARGAHLYVTLEPCCHHGRTPPCTDAILRAGVARVVAAVRDPNPLVRGRGAARLRRAGLDVRIGCLAEEALRLNAAYMRRVKTSFPLVTLKAAMSLDGRIATTAGESKWITGEASRRCAQTLRRRADAIAVGIETVLADDPRLTLRRGSARAPRRVVFDSRLRTPPGARLFRERGGEVLLLAGPRAPKTRRRRLVERGARVIDLPAARTGPGVSVRSALRALGREGIDHLLVEGGGRLATSLLASGLVSEVALFYAPILLGGERPAVRDLGIARLRDALEVTNPRWRRIGGEIFLRGELAARSA